MEVLVPIIVELLMVKLAQQISEQRKRQEVAKEVEETIRRALQRSFSKYPRFRDVVEGQPERLQEYFQSSEVQTELSKLIAPAGGPNIEVLASVWEDNYSGVVGQTNVRLPLQSFIREVRNDLLEIDALRSELRLRMEVESHRMLSDLHGHHFHGRDPRWALSTSTETGDIHPEDHEISIRIDEARKQLRSGHVRAAQSRLQDLKKEAQSSSNSLGVRIRIETLLAESAIALEDLDQALLHLDQAYRLDPNSSAGLISKARGHLLRDEWEGALKIAEELLETDGDDHAAATLRIYALAQLGQIEHVADLIEEKHLNKGDYVRTLAFVYRETEQLAKAEEYFRRAIALNSSDYYARIYLVRVLIDQYLAIGLSPPAEPQLQDAEWNEKYEEAATLLEKLLLEHSTSDAQHKRCDILVNRAWLRLIVADVDGAKSDCDKVLSMCDSHSLALLHRTSIELMQDDPAAAARFVDQFPEEYRYHPSWLSIGIKAYILADRLEDAEKWLQSASDTGNDEDLQSLPVLRVWLLVKQGRVEEATKIRDDLVATDAPSTHTYVTASILDTFLGNEERAGENLRKAWGLASVEEQPEVALRLAIHEYKLENYKEAAKWFSVDYPQSITNTNSLRAYVQCLYASKDFEAVCKVSQYARERGVIDPLVVMAEAAILETAGDLPGVKKLYELLVDREPQQGKYQLYLGQTAFRQNQTEEARKLFQALGPENLEEPTDLMNLALLLVRLDEPERALHLALVALNRGLSSADIHRAYVELMLSVDSKLESLSPDVVDVNTAVSLSQEGQHRRWVVIQNLLPPHSFPIEYDLSSDFAQQLLGCRVGDVVELRKGTMGEHSYTIEEIQSIYVRAFQLRLEEFATRFPSDYRIQMVDVSDGDVGKILPQVANTSMAGQRIEEVYARGLLTAERVALFRGRTHTETFLQIVAASAIPVMCCPGSSASQKDQRLILETTSEIAISLEAILTLDAMGLSSTLTSRFDRVFVHQSVLDNLHATRLRWQIDKDGTRGTLGYNDGQFTFTEVSPQQIEAAINRLEALERTIRDSCEVVGLGPEFASRLAKSQDEIGHIGPISLASALVAAQKDVPLYADDMQLRTYSNQELDVRAFWTQPLLRDLLSRGEINQERYTELCLGLARHNYFFLAVDRDLITRAIRAHNYQLSKDVRALIAALCHRAVPLDESISISAEVLKVVWISEAMIFSKRNITELILSQLSIHHDRDLVVESLLRRAEGLFYLAPVQLDDFRSTLRQWQRVR